MKKTPNSPKPPEPSSLELTAQMDISAAADSGDGKAPLPRFSMVAYTGGAMRVSAWRYPVVMDLAGLGIPSQSRPIRFGHDAGSGVGHTDTISISDGKLVAAGVVSRDTSAAKEVVVSAKNGFPWQASIGASVEQHEFVKEGQTVLVNGRQFEGPINVVRKATLGEISFVDLGADGNTSARVAAKANLESEMENEKTTVEGTAAPVTDASNRDGAQPTAPAVTAAAPAPVAPVTPTAPSPEVKGAAETIADLRALAAAEQERIDAVRKICGTNHSSIAAQAIRDGWDTTRTELEVLRADRPKPPAVHTPDNTITGNVLEAACVLSANLQNGKEQYDEKALDLASKRFRGGLGLQELLLEAAWANGYTGRNFRDMRSVLRFAFAQDVQAEGFSNVDIGGILSNVSNKFLLEGFFSVERTWRNVCALRSVSDFKTVNSYRLIGGDEYQPVAPGGELKHGTLGNETYANKADTFGLILAIDRRDIINDDLGAITTVPRKLGRGSGSKINDIFWTTFMNNAAFFAAGNKNYLAGATTNLSIDGLTAAEQMFMDQVDSDGKPTGILPAIMLVPTALAALGTQLYKALEIRDNTAGKGAFPTVNPHSGKYRVEVTRYLGNAKYAGNSAKSWYLLADPSDLPVIEVAFLNGQESPTIETAVADFDVLGIQMRAFHDFGCALQDPRGGVRAKGEA